jgi:2-amino-4-hydroxy-6-hydroxymethyldihydropteridine diphosphokinase/dihydropteroate synthase
MKLFGILNITPDSFTDGDPTQTPQQAAAKAEMMIAQGAFAVDIGAESTRPNATPLRWEEEWARLQPVLQACTNFPRFPISIDSYHPETIQRALEFPQVQYINDVNGLRDLEMCKLAAKAAQAGKEIIVMHSLSVPADKNIVIGGDAANATAELENWLKNTAARLINFQIPLENVIFDIGIGFGKTAEQSIDLIKHIDDLTEITHRMGAKMLVGHSRKSFLEKFTDKKSENRDFETAIFTSFLATQNVDYVRVHNIPLNYNASLIGGLSLT